MQLKPLSNIKIVLVEPAGTLNIGAVARVMKNMGLQRLVLVNPQCDPLDVEARKMAVHADDVLLNAQVVDSLPAALAGCQRAIATTARTRALNTELENPRVALPWLLEVATPSAIIFGPEDRGLSNSELNYAQKFVMIPADPDYPALNLSHAVGICAYELSQATLSHQPMNVSEAEIASVDALESYYQQMTDVLLKMGYLFPHTAASRMEKLRRLFNRVGMSPIELALLRGIFQKMAWALQYLPENLLGKKEDGTKN
ncbi:RNA methyltransferase [Merismopedia glauca]|uniref:tRNA (cytidine/uridine-2'-O-)-methyltransferase TrmJ n=1 Tax=Merismopedia glauca CCAP 1448/3 TaxID=1296344 RepID=A0A2T1BXZ6_9CYAN|nr:RNA methyltransferase [Merismopedia glauca]PSB00890.1 RNA methyltransferase [Merismopedia glauca CCAP 1448/3]